MADPALCRICQARPRSKTEHGTPMSICDSPTCTEEALRRLDAAGVLPDGWRERLGLIPLN